MTTATWRAQWARAAEAIGDRTAARWMCEVASGRDGAEFVAELDTTATERMLAHLDAMVARRRGGEPLQYVLGRWGFRRLDLAVDRRVLIPRPETELVVDTALAVAAALPRPITLADLGTGSGAIGLALADELGPDGVTVWLTDCDPAALDVARANLAGLGRAALAVRIVEGDWFDALPESVAPDLVVANPPYIAIGDRELDEAVRQWEPAAALFGGADGLLHVRRIVTGAAARLRPNGWLVLEIGATQGAAVHDLAAAAGLIDVDVRADLAGRDRVVVARRPERR